MNMKRLLLLATAVLLFTPAAAMADGVLNFNIVAPASGTIAYGGE